MKWILFSLATLVSTLAWSKKIDPKLLKVAPGFQIDYFSDHVPGARSLALGQQGTVFVGTREEGKVYALVDSNGDGRVDRQYTIASGLDEPNGVAFKNGALYVAETSRILKFPNVEKTLKNPPKPLVLYRDLPEEKHHGWRYIAFGPEGLLYLAIGAPCNVCESKDPRFGTVLRMSVEQVSKPEIFATGIRNSEGFDWHPRTHELWFTDNGRDLLGDDVPSDELNRAAKAGLNFGFPYCHAGDVQDPEFGNKQPCSKFEKPIRKLGAHRAALGMRFWQGHVLIAEHGSWNRSTPVGYRVVEVPAERFSDEKVLAEGWLTSDHRILGRPVDVLPLKDGSVLISDDYAGVVYRISKAQPGKVGVTSRK